MRIRLRYRRVQQRGQWTLMGLLVAMAIIVILSAYLYPKYMTPGGSDGSVASPEDDAQDIACGTYYNQIGTAIVEYRDDHGHVPRSLRSLKSEGVTKDMYDDPYCKFTYDPSTGMLGDKDTPLPAAPAPVAETPNTTAGTPGYNGIATTTAPPPSDAPPVAQQQPGNAPNTDIYSKAQHAGDGDSGGGGDWHHGDGGGGGGSGSSNSGSGDVNNFMGN